MTLRNVLYIMSDQLRWDHLSCAGHPYLRTPNVDALADRGVRFSRAFANSGVCGPSRMSFYTGRYPLSHGATWNVVPMSVAQRTLGAYLEASGRSVHLCGKSHVVPDLDGIERLGLFGHAAERATTGGFVEWFRHDGHRPPSHGSAYPAYLRGQGYESDDPWTDFVIATVDGSGTVHSGWAMRNASMPARVRESDSETAYTTDRAISFIEGAGDDPWVLHVSYVKPHWPYAAPAPYHAMFRADQCLPVLRSADELGDAHPVIKAYRDHDECRAFQADECIRTVRPVYQGLIRQLDDHLGRLFECLERCGSHRDTLVIFTSDHGDLLGDHWLGEKELFYDAVQRIPLIVFDPRTEADGTRGSTDGRFVEAVDIVPTILDALGIDEPQGTLEGQSLIPALNGSGVPLRRFVYSELDYGFRKARLTLGVTPSQARGFSIREERWRYVYWLGFSEQLFDLASNPDELHDLGTDATYASIRQSLRYELGDFLMRRRWRTTVTDAFVSAHTNRHRDVGVRLGEW